MVDQLTDRSSGDVKTSGLSSAPRRDILYQDNNDAVLLAFHFSFRLGTLLGGIIRVKMPISGCRTNTEIEMSL